MAALLYASRADDCPYEIALVASNNSEAGGLKLAAAEGVPIFALPHQGMDRAAHDAAMDEAIRRSGAEYVALAGYMRILTPDFVDGWAGRMLNVHPSLLPLYKGLGTHAQAIANKDSHAGCSVHLVTNELDGGPVLGQSKVVVLPDDTEESLAARVLLAEHQLYSRVLAKLVTQETDPQWLTARVRDRAMKLPEAEETLSHGMACFGIEKGKKFAYVSSDHHGDGKTALLVKISGADEQQHLIEQDSDRFYRPAYFGDGWIAIRLDLRGVEWDEIGEWLARSWRSVAPRRLTRLMEVADKF